LIIDTDLLFPLKTLFATTSNSQLLPTEQPYVPQKLPGRSQDRILPQTTARDIGANQHDEGLKGPKLTQRVDDVLSASGGPARVRPPNPGAEKRAWELEERREELKVAEEVAREGKGDRHRDGDAYDLGNRKQP
jgi:hypothetical protein